MLNSAVGKQSSKLSNCRMLDSHSMSGMRVLFLTGNFSPHGSANGICVQRIIEELKRANCPVTCICLRTMDASSYEVIGGTQVYRVRPRLSVRLKEEARKLKGNLKRGALEKCASVLGGFKSLLSLPFKPLLSICLLIRYYLLAERIHRNQSFDLVIASYNPLEPLIAGYFLKRRHQKLYFVPYFLDALYGGKEIRFWPRKLFEYQTKYYEKTVVDAADFAVIMKSNEVHHLEAISGQYFRKKYRVLDIPLIEAIPPAILPQAKSFSKSDTLLAYAGGIRFVERNPEYLLLLLYMLAQENLNFHAVFAGPCDCLSLFRRYEILSAGRIRHVGLLSREKASNLLNSADFLLNIGNTSPNMVPSKIFEYINARKPIISTASNKEDSSIPYLEKYKNCIIISEEARAEEQVEPLKEFIKKSKGEVADPVFESDFYLNTPQAFIDLLEREIDK